MSNAVRVIGSTLLALTLVGIAIAFAVMADNGRVSNLVAWLVCIPCGLGVITLVTLGGIVGPRLKNRDDEG
jgi:hypothetical protein